jgi:hypothetical protein
MRDAPCTDLGQRRDLGVRAEREALATAANREWRSTSRAGSVGATAVGDGLTPQVAGSAPQEEAAEQRREAPVGRPVCLASRGSDPYGGGPRPCQSMGPQRGGLLATPRLTGDRGVTQA